jgi:hypothetical protein
MKRVCCAAVAIGLSFIPHNASALARWECRGLTPDKIVLTPYQDGSVNLSFNDGGVTETTRFSHKGDVFTAIFKDVTGGNGTLLVFIIDTITRTGYELFDQPGKGSGATKITCWWYQK